MIWGMLKQRLLRILFVFLVCAQQQSTWTSLRPYDAVDATRSISHRLETMVETVPMMLGWTRSISHRLETMVETMLLVGIFVESSITRVSERRCEMDVVHLQYTPSD